MKRNGQQMTILERITFEQRKAEKARKMYRINIIPRLVSDSLDMVKITQRVNYWILRDVKYARENRICLFCGAGKKSVKGNNSCRKCGNGYPMTRKIRNISPNLLFKLSVKENDNHV